MLKKFAMQFAAGLMCTISTLALLNSGQTWAACVIGVAAVVILGNLLRRTT
jgi:hypothetical protein